MKIRPAWQPIVLVAVLLGGAVWLRWPTFGFSLWNVDEAIHAAAARTILDGGVLYRDAIDQRTPLSYYTVAGLFAAFGENNLWAVRCFIAVLIAATGGLLYLCGRSLRQPLAGAASGLSYVLLSGTVLAQGDAYAANTEWFVAFFTSAGAAIFLRYSPAAGPRYLIGAGALFGCAFLSKQPALLDAAPPLVTLACLACYQTLSWRAALRQSLLFVLGWLAPVLLVALYFTWADALRDGLFYAWTYNLNYYGPEIDTINRVTAAVLPFQLLGRSQPWLLAIWGAGAGAVVLRLVQRAPRLDEKNTNPGLLFVAAWSLTALAGTASGGRDFQHYAIQFFAPFCLGAGLAVAALVAGLKNSSRHPVIRAVAGLLLLLVAYQACAGAWQARARAWQARARALPEDTARRVSAYIREHSAPTDRIFVWGYHPDIYLYADRLPASRFLYASFITGLVPWTNVAPERDTAYAIVPGAMETLLQDLAARPPRFIVDCSAGPNRFWQKYPLAKYPPLQAFVRQNYRLEEPHQFVPQGFGLYQRLNPGENHDEEAAMPPLPAAMAETLQIGRLTAPLAPIRASARHGAGLTLADGHLKYFVHAPSILVYRVPAHAGFLRGGFGFLAGAYAPENQGLTDGAEFVVRWRPDGSPEQILLRRLLRPREETADRDFHAFRVAFDSPAGGELELEINTGPHNNSASDWTYWADLMLENSR